MHIKELTNKTVLPNLNLYCTEYQSVLNYDKFHPPTLMLFISFSPQLRGKPFSVSLRSLQSLPVYQSFLHISLTSNSWID